MYKNIRDSKYLRAHTHTLRTQAEPPSQGIEATKPLLAYHQPAGIFDDMGLSHAVSILLIEETLNSFCKGRLRLPGNYQIHPNSQEEVS